MADDNTQDLIEELLQKSLQRQPKASMTVGQPQVLKYGATEVPTLDLQHRPYVENADGSVSTVRSMGVRLGGKEVLIPTVSKDGWVMNDKQAIDEYRRTGEHMGVYPDARTSDRAGQRIHEEQAAGNPPINTLSVRHVQLPKVTITGRRPKQKPFKIEMPK